MIAFPVVICWEFYWLLLPITATAPQRCVGAKAWGAILIVIVILVTIPVIMDIVIIKIVDLIKSMAIFIIFATLHCFAPTMSTICKEKKELQHFYNLYVKKNSFYHRHLSFISSVRSSYSHPDLLLITTPLFQITPVLNTRLSLSEPLQLYKGYNAI